MYHRMLSIFLSIFFSNVFSMLSEPTKYFPHVDFAFRMLSECFQNTANRPKRVRNAFEKGLSSSISILSLLCCVFCGFNHTLSRVISVSVIRHSLPVVYLELFCMHSETPCACTNYNFTSIVSLKCQE